MLRKRLRSTLPAIRVSVMLAVTLMLAACAAPQRSHDHTGATHAPTATSRLSVRIPTRTFASSALVRVPRWPGAASAAPLPRSLRLSSVRNARVSAQLVVIAGTPVRELTAAVSALTSASGAVIPASDIDVRYVGYVPFEKKSPKVGGATVAEIGAHTISGRNGKRVIADPLFERASASVPAHAAQPIWFTFRIPATAAPGTYRGHITIASARGTVLRKSLVLTVHQPVLPDPGEGRFRLNVWFNPDAVAVAYGVRPWSAAHWTLLKRYFRFLAAGGQRTILTTLVKYPWRVAWNDWKPQTAVGYDSMVKWTYDGSDWHFDFTRFDRYVRAARAAGLGPDIAASGLIAFRGPQRLTWRDTRTGRIATHVMKASSPRWRNAWCAFMHDFTVHLKHNGWLAHTWLGFDERPASILKPAMAMLQRCAPSLAHRTLMAGTQHIDAYAQNLSLGLDNLRAVSDVWIRKRHAAGKLTTFYVWAGDKHPNTLTFSPAVESRMMGWIVAKRHLDGYLHWAVDDWTRDVFHDPVFAFSQGDEYLIYPGKHGPVSSIRWELLREGMQDAELVALARAKHADGKVLARALQLATRHPDGPTKDVHDITRARAMVVSLLDGRD